MYPDLHNTDCMDMLASLGDECAHACITDPPGGLGFLAREWDSRRTSKSSPLHLRARDSFVDWLRLIFEEVKRCLLPGGVLIAWQPPKTYWTDMAAEEAGLEKIGLFMHLCGQTSAKGFLSERQASASGLPTDANYRRRFNTAFNVPSVDHWVVYRKRASISMAQCFAKYATGFWPIGDYRVPREARPLISRVAREGDERHNASWRIGVEKVRGTQVGKTDEGSLPKDVELVCMCNDEAHAPDCITSKLGEAARYFHMRACFSPKARAQVAVVERDTDEGAAEINTTDGWRLFDASSGDLVDVNMRDYLRARRPNRVRVYATGERHEGCEHLLWERKSNRFDRITWDRYKKLPPGARCIGNMHVTVKDTRLMRPMIETALSEPVRRGLDPVLIEPFAGSGSTVLAALDIGGIDVVASETCPMAWDILRARVMNRWQKTSQQSLF